MALLPHIKAKLAKLPQKCSNAPCWHVMNVPEGYAIAGVTGVASDAPHPLCRCTQCTWGQLQGLHVLFEQSSTQGGEGGEKKERGRVIDRMSTRLSGSLDCGRSHRRSRPLTRKSPIATPGDKGLGSEGPVPSATGRNGTDPLAGHVPCPAFPEQSRGIYPPPLVQATPIDPGLC